MQPHFDNSCRLISTCLTIALVGTSAAQTAPTFTPKWLESGLHEKGLGYRPMAIPFAPALAGEVKKAPEDLVAPSYGSFKTGPKEAPVTHLVIVDFADHKPTRLLVDANANGDLTDDPVCKITTKEFERPDGTVSATDSSNAVVDLTADGKIRGAIQFYYVRSDVSKPGPAPQAINYFTDFGVTGEVKIGDKTLTAMVSDDRGTGQFTADGGPRAASMLWIDANGNGKADRGEAKPAGSTFEAEGKWWKVVSMTPDGAFQLAETEKPAAPKAEISKLEPGMTAPSFTATQTDGKKIEFPASYKGKVVLIDFWATWCGPCVAEIPNVIEAYTKYHDQGLEVLGISLDKEGMGQKLAEYTAKKGMPWPQVYDGKFWNAAVAKTYEIHSIPHMILIDGDTGIILANKAIRGEALAPAIEKALAAKKK